MRSLIVQICGLLLTMAAAAVSKTTGRAMLAAIIIMETANLAGQVCAANEGPGSFAGFFILPAYGVAVAFVTFKMAAFVRHRRHHNKREDNESIGQGAMDRID